MHWWQIAIRLLLIANCFGNLRGAIRAGREQHRERLHWLIPKAVAWAMLFFALLPARWGGVGMKHWELFIWIGIVLFFYGMIIEMTDSDFPTLYCFSVELPHIGRIDPPFMPLFMAILPLTGVLWVGTEIAYQHHITSDDKVLLVGFSLGFIFGVRLLLRQYQLSKLSDLVELAKLRPRPLPTPAQHDWIRPDKDEAAS